MIETTTAPILTLETPADLPAAMAALTEAYELHTKHKRKLRDAVARAEKKYQPDVYASGKVLDQLEREVEEFCRDQRHELLAHRDSKTLDFGVTSIEFRQTPPKVQCDTKKVLNRFVLNEDFRFVRTKHELNLNALKAAIRSGERVRGVKLASEEKIVISFA